jgi:hypothetical protein
MLLPDGGPSLGERLGGDAQAAAMADALAQYGRLQRSLAPRTGELPPLGVPDMRPEAMPERFAEALEAAHASAPSAAGELAAVEALADDVARWCERLAASPVPASLDHNDLHQRNVLGSGPYRFYDWGDAVVAHPFAAMLVPSKVLRGAHLARARDAYLSAFTDLAPPDQLAEELDLACRVARIARALTWERALRTARPGDPIDPGLAYAPYAELTAILT